MKLIVGLGNPGEKYIKTRHNVGFVVVSKIKNLKINKKFNAKIIKFDETILAAPQTYMNKSGETVIKLANFYKIEPKNILVICDDLDLDIGTMRIRKEGSSGGQKGLKSIIQNLGTDKFIRLRIGIGTNKVKGILAEDYVLSKFSSSEQKIIAKSIDKAVESVLNFIKTGEIEEKTMIAI